MTVFEKIKEYTVEELIDFLDRMVNDSPYCKQNYLYNCSNCISNLDGNRCKGKIATFLKEEYKNEQL